MNLMHPCQDWELEIPSIVCDTARIYAKTPKSFIPNNSKTEIWKQIFITEFNRDNEE